MNDERGELVLVSEYADIEIDDLSGRETDAVAKQLLRSRDRPVAVVEEWLVEQKDVDGLDNSERVIPGEIVRQTPKALLIAYVGDEDWYPKSCTVLFRLVDDSNLSLPQQSLGTFEGGAD